ncbi:pyridine nucleotide-disulfide oxidoreductase domain-containing protein 2 isoform X2 [Loxodonta africana]|uniref:pyridine nucleotide-disulfide oxidoreductase domain-containing protein 2 isoform X2 n=1 Tax=Loxodonta africana TaxID=9785 RepID=UPI0030D49766
MAASGRGLRRALRASPLPAWRQAHLGARGNLKPEYDAVVIGAGFKFSRASYLLSLLRPQIYTDLELKKHGLKLHLRNPHSFTPMWEEGTEGKVPRSLLLGTDMAENQKQIAQFSQKDAQGHHELKPTQPQLTTKVYTIHLCCFLVFSPNAGHNLQNHRHVSLFNQKFPNLAEDRNHLESFAFFSCFSGGPSITHNLSDHPGRTQTLEPGVTAEAFPRYEEFMNRLVSAIDPLLDVAPVDVAAFQHGSLLKRLKSLFTLKPLLQAGLTLGAQLPQYYQVLTAPITKVLDQWFESEPLKATLATDAVIGAMTSPRTPGSGYVLLHHVMGSLEGMPGAWGYVQGGMGAISDAIANSATAHGANIFTEKTVAKVQVSSGGCVQGVVLQDGTEVRSKVVLSNASPQITFLKLTPQEWLPEEFVGRISQLDTQSPVTKINVAVDKLPNFLAAPNAPGDQPLPHHQCSIHLNCEDTCLLHQAFEDAMDGLHSHRPIIEFCIPSSLDPTLAPPGCHVVSLFTQYTPYTLAGGKGWEEQEKNAYADKVFDCIEAYAPGFKGSVVGRDILTPPDLERIFGLPGGNIFHCAMSLDQLYFARPLPLHSSYRSPVPGLYLCGSGAHPGGGVMGAAGRNAAHVVFGDLKSM